MTENKRYMIDNGIAYDSKNFHIIGKEECVDLLNKKEEEIKSLKLENKLLLEEMKEFRDRLSIYLQIRGGVE